MAAVAETEERPWLDELNDEQRAAATHAAGRCSILAGAGTGKTTTLCARVAWLVAEGVPAERILLLTFTRRAAREMLQRARGLVPALVAGPGRHVPFGRAPARAPARRGARAARRLRGARRGRRRRRARPRCARSTGTRSPKTRFPKKGTLLDIYSRTVNAQEPLSGVIGRALPVVRGAPRGDLGAVQGLHGAQARARRGRPRRPAAVLARAGGRRGDRAAARRVVRPRADRRVPGRQRPAGGPRALARLVRADGDRGRRRLPGDLRLPLGLGRATSSTSPSTSPARAW